MRPRDRRQSFNEAAAAAAENRRAVVVSLSGEVALQ